MSVNSSKVTIAALAAGTVGIALYYNWDLFVELSEHLLYTSEKVDALQSLRRINVALTNYRTELEAVEKVVEGRRKNEQPIDIGTKNIICALSTDLDFVFTSLDKVFGDHSIKVARKKLVNEFEALSGRVDALASLVQ